MKNKNLGTFFPKEVSVAASLIINDLYKKFLLIIWYIEYIVMIPEESKKENFICVELKSKKIIIE